MGPKQDCKEVEITASSVLSTLCLSEDGNGDDKHQPFEVTKDSLAETVADLYADIECLIDITPMIDERFQEPKGMLSMNQTSPHSKAAGRSADSKSPSYSHPEDTTTPETIANAIPDQSHNQIIAQKRRASEESEEDQLKTPRDIRIPRSKSPTVDNNDDNLSINQAISLLSGLSTSTGNSKVCGIPHKGIEHVRCAKCLICRNLRAYLIHSPIGSFISRNTTTK